MSDRFFPLVSIILALILSLPAIGLVGEASGNENPDEPQTRYGFTPVLHEVADPSSEAICVAVGNIDGTNNDDVAIGMNGAIGVYTNDGASGQNFGFSSYQTIAISGYYITRIHLADFDSDSDLDIIALGQDTYTMENEAGVGDPSIGTLRVLYFKNDAGTYTLDTYQEFDDVFYYQSLWYFTDGRYDIEVADLDGDDDVDTVLTYLADTDDEPTTGAEEIRLASITYSGGSLSSTTVHTVSFSVIADMNVHCALGDFHNDGGTDIVLAYGGTVNGGNAWVEVKVWLFNHTGSGANWDSPFDLDPYGNMQESGVWRTMPYAIAVGDFGGNRSYDDLAVSTNRNINTEPALADTGIWYIQNQGDRWKAPKSVYTEDYNFMMRGLEVGNLDGENVGREDLIGFTKQDQTGEPPNQDPYDAIDGYGVTLMGSKDGIPYGFFDRKIFETPTDIEYQVIKDVGVGNFDGETDYDDVVFVGDYITIGLTTYPPNNPPSLVSTNVNPSQILNNDQLAVVNLTVQDLDGSWDLRRVEVDFTPIGLPLKSITEPVKDPDDNTIGYYEFEIRVKETVMEGDYEINVSMYDGAPITNEPKSFGTLLFSVRQYNRRPEIELEPENRTVYVMEDTVTYIENIYDWFSDLDIIEGYSSTPLTIKMKSLLSNSWQLNVTENDHIRVEMVNGTVDPENWALKITPEDNFHHNEDATEKLYFRAEDEVLKSTQLQIQVKILSVNDPPKIPPQGVPDNNFEFELFQDDITHAYQLIATDGADASVPYRHLKYYFDYDNEEDADWLYVEEDGMLHWMPKNEHVGPHKVTLWVSDGEANVSRVMWFNVTNVEDRPYFVYVSNGTTEITLPDVIHDRYIFTVYEHEEFNLTIKVTDIDTEIDLQSRVFFKCNLTTTHNNTFLHVDQGDPLKAYLHFMAEKRNQYFATFEPKYPPIDTEIIVIDENDPELTIVLPIQIRIINVNDPPVYLTMDKPVENFTSDILYHIEYSAGQAIDPDMDYNDTLTYVWDFDASDGFQWDAQGLNGYYDFERAGDYTITLRVYDSSENFMEVKRSISVSGIKNDTDWDNDGMPNEWEEEYGFDPYNGEDAESDFDGDDLSNLEEYKMTTDPTDPDTDDDGVWDNEDWDPLDSDIQTKPKEEEDWSDEAGNIILIIIIVAVVLIILIALLVFLLVRSRKKAEEEEERRRKAEEMQKDIYEGQDLYSDLPEAQTAAPAVAAAPPQQQLPPPQEESLDDIFGGAGTLPTQAEPQGLPAGPQGAPQQPPAAGLPPASPQQSPSPQQPQQQPPAQQPQPGPAQQQQQPQAQQQPSSPPTSDDLTELLDQ